MSPGILHLHSNSHTLNEHVCKDVKDALSLKKRSDYTYVLSYVHLALNLFLQARSQGSVLSIEAPPSQLKGPQ